MLEKNLQALEINNPQLANKLRNCEYKDIEVYQTESDEINITYKKVLLHNNDSPAKEAEALFKERGNKDSKNNFAIVYGLGLGYLFKRSYVSSVGKIILFEPFLDVLRFTLQYVDFSGELSDGRVFVCTSIDEVLEVLNKKYILGDFIDIVFLPSYVNLDLSILESLSREIISLVRTRKQDQNTVLHRSLTWGIKSLKNIENVNKALPVDVLHNKFDTLPIVIVSAGPTLEENIENIKKYRNKYVLLTINTAMRALIKNDIIPDFCVISEDTGIDSQFEGLDNLNQIHYILHSRAQKMAWALSDSTNFVYFTETDGFSSWYNKMLDSKYKLWPSAGTVSLLAFYVATKVFNAQNIILVGQDLALVNNQIYSPSAIKDNEEYKIENNGIKLTSPEELKVHIFNHLKIVPVKNYLGEEVLTRNDYFEYIAQYEDILKNELSPDVKIINTSLKGAFIEGMTYISFEEALSGFNEPGFNLSDRINDIINQNNPLIKENIKTLEPKTDSFFKKLDSLIPTCHKLINIIEEFNSTYADNPTNPNLINLMQSFYAEKKIISDFIGQEEILFFMMQNSYLIYLQNYITPSNSIPLTLKEHFSNINCELNLLKDFMAILGALKAVVH